jgi:hypothetical protein
VFPVNRRGNFLKLATRPLLLLEKAPRLIPGRFVVAAVGSHEPVRAPIQLQSGGRKVQNHSSTPHFAFSTLHFFPPLRPWVFAPCVNIFLPLRWTNRTSPKRRRAAAIQDAGALPDGLRRARSVLECASPLALFHPFQGKNSVQMHPRCLAKNRRAPALSEIVWAITLILCF